MPGGTSSSKKEKRRVSAERRRDSSALTKKVKKAESLVERLILEKQEILERLADPALYLEQPEDAKQLQQKIGWLQRDLDAAEAAWIAGQEELESAAEIGAA